MNFKIAIAGPDGAGKTTLCQSLANRLGKCQIEYGGKARNHKLKSTRFAFSIMSKARELWSPLYFPFRYFWFYPFEYFENRKRFRQESQDNKDYIIFDRHPIDRLVLPHDIDLKLRYKKVSRLRWILEKPPRLFWAFIYRHFFNQPVIVFVLLPTPQLCFNRSHGQYQTVEDAFIRIESYRYTIQTARKRGHYIGIEVHENKSIEDLVQEILEYLDNQI